MSKFRVGDYIKKKADLHSVPIQITMDWHAEVINAQSEKYEKVNAGEYEKWWRKKLEEDKAE